MLSAATSASGGFSENSTVWKFTKSAAFLLPSLRTFTSLRSSYSHRWQGPSKVHGWGKWKQFFWVCIRPPAQTGTIVCCMCCIWDNISCCALAISMSWCDGVIIPSLSISLWAQTQTCMFTHGGKTTRIQSMNLDEDHSLHQHQFQGKYWQTFSSKETLIPKTNSYLGAQGHI